MKKLEKTVRQIILARFHHNRKYSFFFTSILITCYRIGIISCIILNDHNPFCRSSASSNVKMLFFLTPIMHSSRKELSTCFRELA